MNFINDNLQSKLLNNDKNILYVISIIFVIFFIFIYNNIIRLNNFYNHLNGMWKGSESFLELSDLNEMILFIDDNKGYIVINNDECSYNDNVLVNTPITFECDLFSLKNIINISSNLDNIIINAKIKEMENEWKINKNDKYSIKISTVNNTMEIYNDNTIFAMLERIPDIINSNEINSEIINDKDNKTNNKTNAIMNTTVDSEKL